MNVSGDHFLGEARFHDRYFRGEIHPKSWFEKWVLSLYPAMPDAIDKLLRTLGQTSGKYICEIGCGGGELTYALAARGARVSAIDISEEAVRLAQNRNREFTAGQVNVQLMDACDLRYNNGTFDMVAGAAILHHLDLKKAGPELSRVLKQGGKAVFIEPLAYNPVSNLWRRLSPSIRTETENPLAYSDILEVAKNFSSVAWQEYALLTLLSSFVFLLTHNYKAKVRSAQYLGRFEPAFLRICKPLRRYSGAILIEFTK